MVNALVLLALCVPRVGLAGTAECAPLNHALTAIAAGEGAQAPFDATGGATCTVSARGAAAPWVVCQWRAPYRSPKAQARFEALSAQLEACLGVVLREESGVNHPDSYDQRQAAVPGALISLSKKDKAALGATFVFLRLAPAP